MARRDHNRDSEPAQPLDRGMIKYIFSGLCGVIMTGVTAGLPMYARFVTMETTIGQLAVSVKEMSNQVYELKIEVTQLQASNNLLNYEVKERLNGPTKD
jgi:hypothetical protein